MSIESINEPGGSNLVSDTPASINEPPVDPPPVDPPPVDETRPPIEPPDMPPAIPATHHRPRPTTTLPGKRKPLGRD